MSTAEAVGKVAIGLALVVGAAAISGYPTKWIMNWLFTPATLHSLFGTGQIGFWQAFWFNTLCSLLFKSTNSAKVK